MRSIRPVDTNGCVVDKAIVDTLDRHPGDLLSLRVTGALVLITRSGPRPPRRHRIRPHLHPGRRPPRRRDPHPRAHAARRRPDQALLVVHPSMRKDFVGVASLLGAARLVR
ncbi:hypothetical protein [Nocardia carnea]|uniref:hypothetical protein n=1 Tax=Nocardia carnea TaxID=37328 RepID=UPI002456B895|nr:hypothetical protein [Nocardia carnea]